MSTTRPTNRPRLRWLRRLLLVVLVVVLVFLLGGGWYFAGRIRSDALEVKSYPVERNLTLDPTPGTVRIRSTDAKDLTKLRAPSTFGLKWTGGYGRVSGPVVSSGKGTVERTYEVVSGDPPKQGAKAELDLVAFPDNPTFAFGRPVPQVSYTSPRGPFPAYVVPASGAEQKTWAVLVHGKGGSRMEMYRMARDTVQAGMPSMDITYRNDEGTPKDPSGYYQYGRTEWRDLEGAIAYAEAHGAEKVVLGADSMGAGIVASYLRHRESGIPGIPVIGIVFDSPMLDFEKTVEYGASQIDLPVIGGVPDSLAWTAKRIASARYDVDWDAVDYLDDLSWLKVPVLVFHGTADTTVPISTSRRFAREKPDLVTLVRVKGAEHVRTWNADPDTFDSRVQKFLADL